MTNSDQELSIDELDVESGGGMIRDAIDKVHGYFAQQSALKDNPETIGDPAKFF